MLLFLVLLVISVSASSISPFKSEELLIPPSSTRLLPASIFTSDKKIQSKKVRKYETFTHTHTRKTHKHANTHTQTRKTNTHKHEKQTHTHTLRSAFRLVIRTRWTETFVTLSIITHSHTHTPGQVLTPDTVTVKLEQQH